MRLAWAPDPPTTLPSDGITGCATTPGSWWRTPHSYYFTGLPPSLPSSLPAIPPHYIACLYYPQILSTHICLLRTIPERNFFLENYTGQVPLAPKLELSSSLTSSALTSSSEGWRFLSGALVDSYLSCFQGPASMDWSEQCQLSKWVLSK